MKRRLNINRRDFCLLASTSIASVAAGSACNRIGGPGLANSGRLTARPRSNIKTNGTGKITLDLGHNRNPILHIPPTSNAASLPLLLMLHGATQSADDMFWYLNTTPDEAGIVVLAPNARDTTWDGIGGSFGEDVDQLNRALERVFETVAIDPARIAIGGFSDGASYGLSLGLINGDLFSRVAAFSPGFLISGTPHGNPQIYISHGTHDHILPIDRCGRRIAAGLIANGYDVEFSEFNGDHEIPPAIAREAMMWLAAPRS